ncbi:MAG: hypothetical protein ACTHKG_06920 [Nocardioides sp.]
MDPAGLTGPTRGQAQGPGWRQSSRGFHVPTRVDPTAPAQRAAEAAVRLPAAGALTGWASLHLQGAGYLDGVRPDGRTRLPVPLALGRRGNIRGGSDVLLLRDPLPVDEIVMVHGLPCTIPERAVFDEMRLAGELTEAMVAVDMAALAELTSLVRVRAYATAHAGWRGVPLVHAGLDLADENSWSPNETRSRKVWSVDAGLPKPLVNQPIFDLQGRLLGYPDLLDVEPGLVAEYDGADHRRAARHSADVGREARFRAHGLEVTRITGPDLRNPTLVRDRLLEARSRARWEPESERRWTTALPAGWEAEPDLEVRLVERELRRGTQSPWGQVR